MEELPPPEGVLELDFLPVPLSEPASEKEEEYFRFWEEVAKAEAIAAPLFAIGRVGGVSRPY